MQKLPAILLEKKEHVKSTECECTTINLNLFHITGPHKLPRSLLQVGHSPMTDNTKISHHRLGVIIFMMAMSFT